MWTDCQLLAQIIPKVNSEEVIMIHIRYAREIDSYAVKVTAEYRGLAETIQFGGCQPRSHNVQDVRQAVKEFAAYHKMDDLAVAKLRQSCAYKSMAAL